MKKNDLVTVAEVEILTGLSRPTLQRRIQAGEFPKAEARIGPYVAWRRETVERFVASEFQKGRLGFAQRVARAADIAAAARAARPARRGR